jgi:hypothetical protein
MKRFVSRDVTQEATRMEPVPTPNGEVKR